MNAFLAFNKWVGFLFAFVVASVATYVGMNRYTDARRQLHKKAETYLGQMVEQSMRDLPPGLNGEYPADGPMADFYREHPTFDGSYIKVAPE